MKAVKTIDIYLIQKRNVKPIDVVQYDTGIQLVFNVKDFTIPSGTTATLYVQKPSGKFVYQETGITVSGNVITINLDNQAITEHGKVPYQVSLNDEITTFTGLLMVEKSLKDANATESKTVVRAFDDAVADHVAEFQTKAEQIVQGCIATIPDDYTTLEAKVNELANAVKGHLSGAVVAADDVSPVEHNPSVWVHGKNLLKNTAVTQTIDGVTFTTNSGGSVTANGTAGANAPIRYVLGEAVLPPGRYVVSGQSEGVSASFVMYSDQNGNNHQQHSGQDAELTLTKTAKINVYFVVMESRTVSNITVYPMIRLASVSDSNYEPYLDPSTVTVKRYGKNLLKNTLADSTSCGVKRTVNSDGSITFSGTSTEVHGIGINAAINLPDGKYIISGGQSNLFLVIWGMSVATKSWVSIMPDKGDGAEFVADSSLYTHYLAQYQGLSGVSYACTSFPMIRAASVADDSFEAYIESTTHIPSSDGTVSGVTSLSPNMTILTDTVGAIVECEYNRDTNKVINKIIAALGGTI